MATTLRDFIAHREGEIRDQLKALRSELKELQLAKTALGGQERATPAPTAPTIKDMARTVLAKAAEGMTSAEILTAIKERFDREIDRTSLSPQLSRLKTDAEVALVGEKWFSKELHREKMNADYENLVREWNAPPSEEDDDLPPF